PTPSVSAPFSSPTAGMAATGNTWTWSSRYSHSWRAMMNRIPHAAALLAALPLVASGVQAAESTPQYRDPLTELTIDTEGNNYQFERSSLEALKIHDPIEGFNRRMYRFNGQFDEYVYLPAVNAYKTVTPTFVRTGVANVFANLADVPNLANSLAQGKLQKSGRTTARLLFNTT